MVYFLKPFKLGENEKKESPVTLVKTVQNTPTTQPTQKDESSEESVSKQETTPSENKETSITITDSIMNNYYFYPAVCGILAAVISIIVIYKQKYDRYFDTDPKTGEKTPMWGKIIGESLAMGAGVFVVFLIGKWFYNRKSDTPSSTEISS